MSKYIAFLKGLNVSGQKMTRIRDWNSMFEKLGLKKANTNIESGNVLFESNGIDLSDTIEKGIRTNLGYDVTVFLKTIEEVKELMDINPFKEVKGKDNLRTYITFLNGKPTNDYAFPMIAEMKGIEIIMVSNGIVLSIGTETNGTYYSPNSFIESELGASAATRNWTAINKLISRK